MKIHSIAALFVLGIGLSGCAGDDPGNGGGNADSFVGTWKYTSGTVTTVCAGATNTTQLSGQDEEFARAVDGGLTLKGNCATKLALSGGTATAQTGATCTDVGSDGSSSTYTYSSLVYSTPDGLNMTVSASGNITVLADGQSLACTFSITGGLMKYAD